MTFNEFTATLVQADGADFGDEVSVALVYEFGAHILFIDNMFVVPTCVGEEIFESLSDAEKFLWETHVLPNCIEG